MKVGEKMEREEYVQAFCAGNQMRIQEEAGALEELQRVFSICPTNMRISLRTKW